MTVPGAPDTSPPARPLVDRAGADRDIPGVLDALAADPTSRVLAISRSRAPLAEGGAALQLVGMDDVDASSVRALLGRDESGAAVLLAVIDERAADRLEPAGGWGELRTIGGILDARDFALLIEGLALARWLEEAEFCPYCGTRTELHQAGWSRLCPSCGRQHFPRTDPAVIVAVTDASTPRLLLGSNSAWPAGRYSCFAGFVEAGESAESTIVREVYEEAGVDVVSVEYAGSQAWPYPRSLMLGFLAAAVDPRTARPDGVEIADVRWFTPDEIGAALEGRGDVTLPGSASIARRLIETWHSRVTVGG